MDVWALAGDFLTTCFFRPGTLLLCPGAVAAWLLFKAIRKYKWGLLYNFIAGVMVVVCHIDVLLALVFLVLLLPFPYLGRVLSVRSAVWPQKLCVLSLRVYRTVPMGRAETVTGHGSASISPKPLYRMRTYGSLLPDPF